MRYIKTVILLVLLSAVNLTAGQDFSRVEITTTKLSQGIYMLQGAGGNLALSAGEDGVFLIDDQYAPLTQKITAAISQITDKPIKFLINTHWHADHTGGNENIGKGGTVIVAHDNVRKRMSTDQMIKAFNRMVQAAPPKALPVVTFPKALTFHWNGETIEVIHFPGAHTDGDSAVFFKTANVIHTGDLFFNGIYPFIDAGSGGTVSGMIQSVDLILERADGQTKIVPGHGPLAGKADLEKFRKMLALVETRISGLLKSGKTPSEIIAAKPTSDLDAEWGNGFLKPDHWVKIVVSAMGGSKRTK